MAAECADHWATWAGQEVRSSTVQTVKATTPAFFNGFLRESLANASELGMQPLELFTYC